MKLSLLPFAYSVLAVANFLVTLYTGSTHWVWATGTWIDLHQTFPLKQTSKKEETCSRFSKSSVHSSLQWFIVHTFTIHPRFWMGWWFLHSVAHVPCSDGNQSVCLDLHLRHTRTSTKLHLLLSWPGGLLHVLHHPHLRVGLGVKRLTHQAALFGEQRHISFFRIRIREIVFFIDMTERWLTFLYICSLVTV